MGGNTIQNSKTENARRLDKAESIISFVDSSAAVAIVDSCRQILYPKEEHNRCLMKIPLIEAKLFVLLSCGNETKRICWEKIEAYFPAILNLYIRTKNTFIVFRLSQNII